MRAARTLLAALAIVAAPRVASAQTGPGAIGASAPPPISLGTSPGAAPFWSRGEARPFLATTSEAGYLYAKPRFSLGYGQPHWKWVGVEAATLLSGASLAFYGGVQASLPLVQIRAGTFYNTAFSRTFLHSQASYDRYDIEILDGPKSRYALHQVELAGTIPLPVGAIIGTLGGYRIDGVDKGFNVFEEQLHLVVTPPYFWRARLGYVISLGERHSVNLGLIGEYIDVVDRDRYIVRAGLVTGVSINPKIDVVASFIPVIISPDRLGLAGGDFTQLGLRVKWATGLAGDDSVLLP